MKKVILPHYSKIAFIVSGVLLGIYCIIKILMSLNIHVYFSGVGTQEIIPIIISLGIVVFISALSVLFYKNAKHKTLAVMTTVVLSFLILPLLLVFSFFSMNGTYFEYVSDDKKHDIVVNECSFILSGYGDIYEKTSFCTMKRLGGYTTDDGFCPFTNDEFFFVWNENDFELHHAFYGAPDEEYKIVKMKYAK